MRATWHGPILALAVASVPGACAKNSSERIKDAALDDIRRAPEVTLSPVYLGDHGMPATIDAPDGARADTRFQSVTVATPARDFALVIDRAQGTLEARKRVIARNPENKLVAYVVERDHALLYLSRLHTPAGQRDEYHVLVHVDVDGIHYECQDDKSQPILDVALAHTMLRACESMRTAPPSPSPTGNPS